MLRCQYVRYALSVVILSACQVFEPGLLDEQAPVTGGAKRDAGRRAPGAGEGCDAGVELCNDRDDDCDGEVDEDAQESCEAQHALVACASGGVCIVAECEDGYLDCNSRARDGCEQAVDALDCGSCACQPASDPGSAEEASGSGQPAGSDAPGDVTASATDEDAGSESADACSARAERCNGVDDDCDERVDEQLAQCDFQACVQSTPSYRGARCDRCVCERCTGELADCQQSTDPTRAELCRAVSECYVMHSRAGECGSNEDCYRSGNGPCAGEINLAAGGTSATDNSQAARGCSTARPPATACGAVTIYRDACIRDVCATECAD